jgi:hypothetical protein
MSRSVLPACRNQPERRAKLKETLMNFSLYDSLFYKNKLIHGAAAMNARLFLLGGADKFAQNVGAQAAQITLQRLAQPLIQHPQPANDANVTAFPRKRRSA